MSRVSMDSCFWAITFRKQPFTDVHNIGGMTACNFIKKRLQHKCFPENIAKFLRKVFYITPLVVASDFCRDVARTTQISRMKSFTAVINGKKLFTIVIKLSILDVWDGSCLGFRFKDSFIKHFSITGISPFIRLRQWALR